MSKTDRRYNLIAERVRNGYTQKGLAEKIGVSTGTIFNWETMATSPSMSLMPALAEALNMSVEDAVRMFE